MHTIFYMSYQPVKPSTDYLSFFVSANSHTIVVLFTIVAARRTMVSVDLDELERLRYEYKGA